MFSEHLETSVIDLPSILVEKEILKLRWNAMEDDKKSRQSPVFKKHESLLK